MKEQKGRSLYQCLNAKVHDNEIYCSKGHEFARGNPYNAFLRGEPLIFSCCQECPDYDEMGPPVEKADRPIRVRRQRRFVKG